MFTNQTKRFLFFSVGRHCCVVSFVQLYFEAHPDFYVALHSFGLDNLTSQAASVDRKMDKAGDYALDKTSSAFVDLVVVP